MTCSKMETEPEGFLNWFRLKDEYKISFYFGIILVQDLSIIAAIMKKLSLLSIILTFILLSCTKDKIEIDPDNLILGVWNYSEYIDNTQVYTRGNEFSDNPGYKFNSDGTLMERKNAGWCGTPPITYSDYRGKWTILNDTLIRVEVGYWGGTATYDLDVESVNSDYLKVLAIWISNE
jgi:hypothetical protein